jgi:DNA-directed RNA polymerase subunit RPC12/RpoP
VKDRQQVRFCTAPDGTRIAVASIGSGPPLVRAAHWLSHVEHDLQSPVWRPWLRELSRHHTYVRVGRRAAHNEYACIRCGHPLLLAVDRDEHADAAPFPKKIRLRCATFGHAVHQVTVRDALTEYACGCGHSFLLRQDGLRRVHHPLMCRAAGHRVVFVQQRGNYREHRCVRCGHPFLYRT